MSNYNSTNTHILATHEQVGGNTRMLLMHECDSPMMPYEFVIGSYFTQETVCEPFGSAAFPIAYSWDWGHYFHDVVSAVDYWKNEVLGEER